MFKRRDWLLTHGPDGGGDDSSSSDESNDASSIDDDTSSIGEDSREVSGSPLHDDSDDEEEYYEDSREAGIDSRYQQSIEDDKRLVSQLKSWKQGKSKPDFLPVSCLACHGNLLLNPMTYKQHENSNKHLKKLDIFKERNHMAYDTFENLPYCFARQKEYYIAHIVQLPEKHSLVADDGETHEERLARVDKILEQVRREKGKKAPMPLGKEKKRSSTVNKAEDTDNNSNAGDDEKYYSDRKITATRSTQSKEPGADARKSKNELIGSDKNDGKTKRGKKQHRKRPGKRQRQALKEQRQG